MLSHKPFRPCPSYLYLVGAVLGLLWAGSKSLKAAPLGPAEDFTPIAVAKPAALKMLDRAALSARLGEQTCSLRGMVQRLEKTTTAGEPWYLNKCFDQEALIAMAVASEPGEVPSKSSAELQDIFAAGTRNAWEKNSPVMDFLGHELRFLRVWEIKGRSGLLFRSIAPNASLNYHLFCVAEPSNGDFRLVDFYSLGVNEFTSESLGRTYRQLHTHFVHGLGATDAAAIEAGIPLDEKVRLAKQYVESLPQIQLVNQALANRNGDAALEALLKLPEAIQQDRGMLLLRLDAAQLIGKKAQKEAMLYFSKIFPSIQDLPLRRAEISLDDQSWPEAQKQLQAALDLIGGDSHLQFQLGQIHQKLAPQAAVDAKTKRSQDQAALPKGFGS